MNGGIDKEENLHKWRCRYKRKFTYMEVQIKEGIYINGGVGKGGTWRDNRLGQRDWRKGSAAEEQVAGKWKRSY